MRPCLMLFAALLLAAAPMFANLHAATTTDADKAAAEEGAAPPPLLTVQAPDQIVTAARTARTADETLASVTVIERKDIEEQQATSVQEVLRALPGIDIANSGGQGKLTDLRLRGTESDHVLVLVDGIKIGSATAGSISFQHIPVDQIERIEIVRGPRSSLYGSEAIGGVVQIFTRKGGGDTKPHFSVGGGSHGTYQVSGGVSGGGERGWFNVTGSGAGSEGINACDGDLAAGCFTIEPDQDGYRERALSLRAGYRFENEATVDVHALHSTGLTEFDGDIFSGNETVFVQQVLGLKLQYFPARPWRLTLSGGRSRDETENRKDGAFVSTFDTVRDVASIQNDIAIGGAHLLTLGGDFQEDRVESDTAFDVTSRRNTGAFLQYQATLATHDLQLSGRVDQNEQFGSHRTFGAAWGYRFADDLRMTASYGTAFKAPTFNDLYWPGFSNPDLVPETSRSSELGVENPEDWALHLYQTDVEDLIGFDPVTFLPVNISEARIRGVEASTWLHFDRVKLAAHLTLLEPINLDRGANEGNDLPRRARESLRVDATQSFETLSFGATVVAKGKRYDDAANSRVLEAYTTVDLRAEWRFAEHWNLQGRIGNLFDEEYETVSFYNQPGRTAFVTLRYQP